MKYSAMKTYLCIILMAIIITGCKEDQNKEVYPEAQEEYIDLQNGKTAKQNDGLTTFSGQFIYYADAAVLQTKGSIYGVVIDDKMRELNDMAAPLKNEPTDYVTVQIRGKLIPKPKEEEGWPYRIEIKEIESVKAYEAKNNEVIKLGNSDS